MILKDYWNLILTQMRIKKQENIMKKIKYFILFFVLICLSHYTFGEKRVKPREMKELIDPSSPSYVPIPYPKNRKEIIGDLKYAIRKLFVEQKSSYIDGKVPPIKSILVKLLENNPTFTIGDIIKVKNRSHLLAHKYTWLIVILDDNGKIVSRISMNAEGLFGSAADTRNAAKSLRAKYPNSKIGPQFLQTKTDAINRIASVLGESFKRDTIKNIERFAYQSILGGLLAPLWEIKIDDGKTYYYSVKNNSVYEIEKKINWEKDKNGIRRYSRDLIPNSNDYLPDTIEDELIVLKKLNNSE